MSPNLLFYPVSDKRKAFTRIAYGKVVHPTAKDRVDLLDHPFHRLADILSEDLLQLCQQRRPFLQLRRVVRSAVPVTAQDAAIFKAYPKRVLKLSSKNFWNSWAFVGLELTMAL